MPQDGFCLPIIKSIQIKDFSLYSLQSRISVGMSKEVFCLVGANGLGKSTFLSILNFGLTGIVVDPERKFDSVDEYYAGSVKFQNEYFSGRVRESDRDSAEVSLEFSVGDTVFSITRGIFDMEELREFQVFDVNSGEVLVDGDDLSPAERNGRYKDRLIRATGLDTFAQFVFLQRFVLTFDESRQLLFWNSKVLEQALYLAFGVNPEHAKKADVLRRQYERADSLGRNASWQASIVKKKMRDIQEAFEKPDVNEDSLDVEKEYERVVNIRDASEQEISSLEKVLKDTELQLAEFTSIQASVKNQYEEAFSKYINGHISILDHPLVRSSISSGSCALCGTDVEHIEERIHSRVTIECPLCGSSIHGTDTHRDLTDLHDLDSKLVKIQASIDDLVNTKSRLSSELQAAKNQYSLDQAEVDRFEQQHLQFIKKKTARETVSTALDEALEPYRVQLNELLERKVEQYAIRDQKRTELFRLQKELEREYAEAEEKFVPLFRDLAYRFLGLALDIHMENRDKLGINLILQVRSVTRREYHDLSESQRFFVDIALRMALAKYLTAENGQACLMIDTPEGSLDIAYESRAGDMFALFVEDSYRIIMTSNINSSRLLLRLAENCGSGKMELHRMTHWTELSDVQIEEEGLFEEALEQISQAIALKDDE